MDTTRWLLATLHLLALAVGFGAIWGRRRALLSLPAPDALRSVFFADSLWGLAAGLWLVTGLGRVFGPFEKGAAYYMGQPFFLAKMSLFALVFALEVAPMVALIRWRVAARRGAPVDTSRARLWARFSAIQALVLVVMVGLAAAVARGYRP